MLYTYVKKDFAKKLHRVRVYNIEFKLNEQYDKTQISTFANFLSGNVNK